MGGGEKVDLTHLDTVSFTHGLICTDAEFVFQITFALTPLRFLHQNKGLAEGKEAANTLKTIT